MAEKSGRLNHARVKALLPNFEVGAAGEGNLDAHQHLIFEQAGDVDLFDLDVLRTVEDGRCHVTVLLDLLIRELSPP